MLEQYSAHALVENPLLIADQISGFVCATIRSLSQNDAVTLRATLISPVAGVIYFRQTGSEPTVIHGKLYWIDTSTASSVEWAIYDDSVSYLT